MEYTLQVANIKCNGCATSIKNKLAQISGVSDIAVDIENGVVTFSTDEIVLKEQVSTSLKTMGYPDISEENGLGSKVKSYASCMIGRIQN